MQVESALLFETPEEIFARVFRQLKPRTPPPRFRVSFCPFANPDSLARLKDDEVQVRVSDLLQGAPAPILEALAFLLLGKLYRKPVPAGYAHRYRLYLNRRDLRRQAHLVRQLRGRKFLSSPQGKHYDLETIFDELNFRFFGGLMARPNLGWSRGASRLSLGHYDPSHNAIILSKALDGARVPKLAVEYVLYHEMLHLRFPAKSRGSRQAVHTREFHEAEREFPEWKEAKEMLKKL